jgi:hypothetical protein
VVLGLKTLTSNINEGELKLLTYLHEHAAGFGRNFPFDPGDVVKALGLTQEQFQKDLSYLSQHGLTEGHVVEQSQASGNPPRFANPQFWLTGLGEDYMRALEKAPSIGRKLTVAVVTELWSTGKSLLEATAAHLLGEFFKRH